jgi:hypothetical protein
MLFPDPNVARCIMEERLEDTLREAEKARLIREATGAEAVGGDGSNRLLAGLRTVFPSVRRAAPNRSRIKERSSLGSV